MVPKGTPEMHYALTQTLNISEPQATPEVEKRRSKIKADSIVLHFHSKRFPKGKPESFQNQPRHPFGLRAPQTSALGTL